MLLADNNSVPCPGRIAGPDAAAFAGQVDPIAAMDEKRSTVYGELIGFF